MLYCISDIHGEYELFIKLLKKINFSFNDEMIILGDIIDKGENSLKLAKLIFNLPNVKVIMGNHEYEFYKFYQSLKQNKELTIKNLQSYFPYEEKLLDLQMINKIINLPFFIESQNIIYTHSGVLLDNKDNIVDLDKTEIEYFIYNREFKNEDVIPNSNKCVIYGHTPTFYLNKNNTYNIIKYKRKNSLGNSINDYYKIHIDTGASITNVLGCICIDTLEEFYVSR